ncbi:uncharacterized protein BO66DRAFT_220552 [Aspergillus aculeatinus CBS 121060]|uniref:Uncharacterized protein n=1 Tax=Aspergillus aculeatinus CBS 121060 TaxID=1448322 RepID=A0ACD1HIH7_9EURO|nr:hypothetical protein BO66DRAFT_220552 [Aspergillus aculeatinus CBS 121060]RAH73365.1 hypothetical protein BO66DRAFT_220552 [Aspergillus aculeatinus CBS 121060]
METEEADHDVFILTASLHRQVGIQEDSQAEGMMKMDGDEDEGRRKMGREKMGRRKSLGKEEEGEEREREREREKEEEEGEMRGDL